MIEAAIFFAGFLFGVTCGQYYEEHYGETAKRADKYHKALLRIIPKLKPHYTSDYIWELISGGRRHND